MKKIIILSLISFFVIGNTFAQGVFENGDSSSEGISASEKSVGGLFRNKGENPVPEDPNFNPIGSGLLILTTLAGGYALVRNRKSNKK